MRDEFRLTRHLVIELSYILERCNEIEKGIYRTSESVLSECESKLAELDRMDENVSFEVWPTAIRELLDSTESTATLQRDYDTWIKIVSNGVNVPEYEDINALPLILSGDELERVRYLVIRVQQKMSYLFFRIQELKLEYDLQDDEYYNLSPSFRFCRCREEYINGPTEESLLKTMTIPEDIVSLFQTEEKCRVFLQPKKSLSPTEWGKRFKEYAVHFKRWEKGDIKRVFNFLKDLFGLEENQYSTFQKATH